MQKLCSDATSTGRTRDTDNMASAVCPDYIHSTHIYTTERTLLWLRSNYLFRKVPTQESMFILCAV